ncbi:fumarylacetoacetate hydrolase family protein [Acetobacter sacchari]|uniref:Fumarylacetoacetate hydrolase family protein n=1 Tax=Acetobacter sacchari TaxID=2661687 RepID=A0ABS3LWG6_9PROT|nr:fumarylacetoacetate hydrolase family protein [Acetobacter sacchari]MBO1360233.1 fumarylacetoacetate hydrolase family protein [Acetobacter sacchari]
MKIASIITNERKTLGVPVEGGMRDIGAHLDDALCDLKYFLSSPLFEKREHLLAQAPLIESGCFRFLPLIEAPTRLFGVGMNYPTPDSKPASPPGPPALFIRLPQAQVGHHEAIIKPAITNALDFEGEMAVIIGKPTFRVSPEKVLDHVAGYSCFMDGSVRDWQHTWFTAGKNWTSSGSFGPWLVTKDEINDWRKLRLFTYLNGRCVQNDVVGNMLRSVEELISYISTFTPLSPGDVIATGSPDGIGKSRTPPLFLQNGDVIEVEIDYIGRLTNVVKESIRGYQ